MVSDIDCRREANSHAREKERGYCVAKNITTDFGFLFHRLIKSPIMLAENCVHGCFSSQSFWKAGSVRNGSQIGSSLRRAGVTGGGL